MRDELESCFARTHDYSACPAQITAASSGLPVGSARGQVEISEAKPPGATDPIYTIVAHSRSGTDFIIDRWASPPTYWGTPFSRRCSPFQRPTCSAWTLLG